MKIKLFFLVIVTLGFIIYAQEAVHAKSFSIPEYNEKGELVCLIKGDSGNIFGKEAIIKGAEVEIKSKRDPLLLTTPQCKYLLKERRCTSKENVDIKGDGIRITGTGFDIDNVTRKIFIRSNVKVVWKKKNLKKKKNNGDISGKTDKKTEKEK